MAARAILGFRADDVAVAVEAVPARTYGLGSLGVDDQGVKLHLQGFG